MTEPTVTVLMSVFNDRKYVEQAVRSILEQTYRDFEFLIIDDGSTDGSVDIIKRVNDSRIRLISNDRNLGLTKSLNRGIEIARGRYIARMDADDFSYPQRLEKQVEFFETHPEYGLVGTRYRVIDESGILIYDAEVPQTDYEIRTAFLNSNPFAHSSVMFRKELIKEIGGYREFFRYAQDLDLFIRLSKRSNVYNLSEIFLDWRLQLKSSSVKYKLLQDRYAQIARECNLKETLPETGPGILADFDPAPFKTRRAKAEGYFKWAKFFYYLRTDYPYKRKYAIGLLLKSLGMHPFFLVKTFLISLGNLLKRALMRRKH